VDVLRVVFLLAFAVLTLMMMNKLKDARMTMIDLPMNLVYGVCMVGFVAMTGRAIQVARRHWKRGYSVLERPETTINDV
jgi:TRAP-type C4-dicarboxylate transport system permease small subunit